MRLSFLKSPTLLIAASVILCVCILEALDLPGLRQMELLTYDWRVRQAQSHYQATPNDATNLGWVNISDRTIYEVKNDKELGFFAGLYWPRDVYASGLKELTDEGAKVVAFDVLFAEKRSDQKPATLPDGQVVPADKVFAEQLRLSGNVILGASSDELPHRMFRTNAWRTGDIDAVSDGDGVLRRDRAFQNYRDWHNVIQVMAGAFSWDLAKTTDDRKAHKIIFVNQLDGSQREFPTDDEGSIAITNLLNTVPPGYPEKIVPYRDFRVWSMGILMAARQLNLDLDHPVMEPGLIVLHGPQGITRSIPVDDQGYFYIDWSLARNDPSLERQPFELLLASQVVRNQGGEVSNVWRNKMVVIGSTATGNDLSDEGPTPLASKTFLATKHLNVANSVISGRFVRPTRLWVDLMIIVIVGILSAWISRAVERAYVGTLLVLLLSAVYIALSAWLYVQFRIWIPIFLPVAGAGLVNHGCVLIYLVVFEQTQKQMVKQLFSRVLSPDVVNEVLQQESIKLEGRRREITVYFADVRGFTELTDVTQERAENYVKEHNLSIAEAEAYFDERAKETLETVNTYLAVISDVVKSNNGLLDKYIGDCVMAFWGAPLNNPHHALDSVRAAIGAQRAMAELNRNREQINKEREAENVERASKGLPALSPLPVLSMGTGVNTGVAIVGFMGSEEHLLNYTAFGREVNLASRLEGVSGHGRIIIGESTYIALKRDDPKLANLCLEWAPRSVKGFRSAVRIYEVVWQPEAGVVPAPGENTNIRLTKPA